MKMFVSVLCTIAFTVLFGFSAAAKEKDERVVAVLYMVDNEARGEKCEMIRTKIVSELNRDPEYAAFDCTEELLQLLRSTDDRTLTDARMIRIGQLIEVDCIAVVNDRTTDESVYLSARMIDVASGKIVTKTVECENEESESLLSALGEKVAHTLASGSKASSGASGNVVSYTANGVAFNMIKVEGGKNELAKSAKHKADSETDEPIGTFSIGQTEVTQELWKAVMGNNPSDYIGDQLPVTNVSWEDCQQFIERLNHLTGQQFRLPSEAEWEYAARGGNNSQGYKYSGGNDLYRVGWYAENSSHRPHHTAQKLANELDLYDMSGNVWEWCGDTSSEGNDSLRKARGASWENSDTHTLTTCLSSHPRTRSRSIGFRLAR